MTQLLKPKFKTFIVTIKETKRYQTTIKSQDRDLARKYCERLYEQGRLPVLDELQYEETEIIEIK